MFSVAYMLNVIITMNVEEIDICVLDSLDCVICRHVRHIVLAIDDRIGVFAH